MSPALTADGAGGATTRVFISHASADRAFAETLASYLEARAVRCWIAPRDVAPGALYADAIVRAISDARAFVLVLSQSSIVSAHVGKELERASSKRRPIFAVRLDEAPLAPAFEYFLSESQWIDVATLGSDGAFAKLVVALERPAAAAGAPSAAPPARAPARRRYFRPALAAIGVLVLAVAGIVAVERARQAAPVTRAATASVEHSVAVLPFVDMSEAHDQDYFADGMAEEILDLLAKIPALKVIARSSSFQFKGKAEDVRVVGDRLGVATVLEGSVRKAGKRLRITAQLIRASDGSHLWSEVYDREVSDVFRTQDEIAGAVVGALKISLLGAPPPRAAPTKNTEAYALFLQGMAHWANYTAAESALAQDCFQRALKLDPDFALAWAALGGTYGDQMVFGLRQTHGEVRSEVAAAGHRAVELDPRLPEAHVVLSNAAYMDFDFTTAQRELKIALELEPGNIPALGNSVYDELALGHVDAATDFARQVVARDPLSVDPYRGLATALWFGGHLAEAEAEYRKVLVIKPDGEGLHCRLSFILLGEGRAAEALTELDAERSVAWRRIGQVMALDALGRRVEADRVLAVALKDGNGWDYQFAEIYALRGDRDHAFEWLESAYRSRDPGFGSYLRCDPMLAALRTDPRYQTLLAKLVRPS